MLHDVSVPVNSTFSHWADFFELAHNGHLEFLLIQSIQFRECPYQRIHAIRGFTRLSWNVATHLILELGENPQVMNTALLIKSGYRFSPGVLVVGSRHGSKWNIRAQT